VSFVPSGSFVLSAREYFTRSAVPTSSSLHDLLTITARSLAVSAARAPVVIEATTKMKK